MWKTRVLTGAIITAILSLVIIFSHIPWVLNTLIACLSMQAIYELYRAVGLKDNKPLYLISCAVSLLLSIIDIPGYDYIVVIAFVAALSLFLYLMMNVKTLRSIEPWMAMCIAVIIICSFKCMSYIREMDNGVYLLGMTVLVPVVTDIFAYLIGRQCGKHMLLPSISPKKTVEGAIAPFWLENDCAVLFAEQRGQGNSEGIVADCAFTSPHAIWKHVVENNFHLP